MRRTPLVLACVALVGCRQADVVADLVGDADGPPRDGGSVDAGRPAPDAGGPEDFCAGGGPVVAVGDGRCAGDVAERAFRFAVCACEGLVTSGGLDTDSFDSRDGPYRARPGSTGGGAVGINGRIDLNAASRVDGTLWGGDATGLNAGRAGDLTVERNLFCAGPVVSETSISVARDARVNGRVRARDLTVGGTLTVPDGAAIEVTGDRAIGAEARGPVAVDAPCDCRPEFLVDIAALVAARAADHDDARAGLTPDSLQNVSGAVTLPCGRYYFDGISTDGDLALVAEGRVALFVTGDVAVNGALSVRLAPGAELDLLVAGQLVSTDALALGAEDAPSRVRVYVGGSGTLQLSGGGTFGGNLYAPRAEVVASGTVEVFGSLFARRLALADRAIVHFDRAVQAAADDCPEPEDTTCDSCRDCREGGCVGGACGPCRTSADCCAPLVCEAGRCLVEP